MTEDEARAALLVRAWETAAPGRVDWSDDDRRNVTVHLTTDGRRLIKTVFPRHAAAIAEAFSVLTATEQDELARLTKRLGLATA